MPGPARQAVWAFKVTFGGNGVGVAVGGGVAVAVGLGVEVDVAVGAAAELHAVKTKPRARRTCKAFADILFIPFYVLTIWESK